MKTNLFILDKFVLMAHDYTRIYSVYEATMLEDMDRAITECQLWDWVKTFEPKENEGFMFTDHPNLDKITNNLKYGHSGASFAWCVRNMQSIARKGWEQYVSEVLMSRIVQTFAESPDPEKRKQAEAMEKFKKGELSYAEMRELCG